MEVDDLMEDELNENEMSEDELSENEMMFGNDGGVLELIGDGVVNVDLNEGMLMDEID